ncbi:MAG TPA: TetR/AcrR family transcriptional regulator [Micropepsaceae bacterium]|nr:TetR/AcrR family transcriptional regulator [Micropepsaceae bacterium]
MQVVPIRARKAIPTGKRAQGKAANRRIILDAAKRVFAQMGYNTAKVRDIIRATPLASGTFYNYFRSKEEVFQALCDEAARSVGPAMREARHKAKNSETFFYGTFKAFFAHIAERRASGVGPDPLLNQPATLGVVALKQDIQNAISRGVLPPVNAEVLAAAMWGVASGLSDALAEWSDVDDAARSAAAFMLQGFRALGAEPKPVAVNY